MRSCEDDNINDTRATVVIDIIPALRDRHSARAFDSRPIEGDKRVALAEAFRWAPSSSNRQPWSLIFVDHAEARRSWDMALAPANVVWAMHAPLKIIVVGNPKEQPDSGGLQSFALDCGLAIHSLLVQACAMGLNIRAMAGWDEAKLRGPFGIHEPHRVVALIAAGYPGPVGDLPSDIRQKECRPRQRKALDAIAFRNRLGGPGLT